MNEEKPVASLVFMFIGFAAQSLALVIHVWTVVVAFFASGLLAAVFSLMLPMLSTVYWFFKIGASVGYDSVYCVAVMAYVVIIGGGVLMAKLANPKGE